jgi:GTP-binding protein
MLTCAIVGRPNVGKSTLFNRLVGKRVAITLKEPGTTRDRIIQQAEWLGRRFWVIDTGGLMPDATELMMKEIQTQVELAIAEADIVLLLTDGREGLNPTDIDIMRRLQRSKKPFLLVVNKADDDAVRSSLAEFYQLGVAEFYPISAEHGIGVAELLEKLFADFPEPPADETACDIRLVILGTPNVGKSSFLNALLGTYRAIVTETPGTTRDSIEATFCYEGRNYRIVDTAGIRRKSRVAEPIEYFSVVRAIRNIAEADVALLILDVRAGISTQDQKIASLVEARGKGLVVVANKADLIPQEAVKPVQDWLRSTISYISHVPIIFTSALHQKGILEAVGQAARVFDQGGRRLTSAELKDQLLPVLQAHPPRRGAIIYRVKQKSTRPPGFVLQSRDPKAINDAYRKFAEHEIRRLFGFNGYPVRVRVAHG